MRFMPIVLLVGILFNVFCVVLFRIKLDRAYDSRFVSLSETLQSQLVSLTSSALSRIDNYFLSNSVAFASSPVSSSVSDSSFDGKNYLLPDLGFWDYDFFLCDGVPVARVGIVYFRVGDSFPRGGRLTAIYPDCVVIDGLGCLVNRSFSASSSRRSSSQSFSFDVPDTTYKPNKELSNHVRTANRVRE